MVKITMSVLLAASLAACGAGSSSQQAMPTSSAAPKSTFPTAPLSPEMAAAGVSVQAPAVSAKAPIFTGANIRLTTDRQEFLVKSAVASALQLTGTSNAGWIADGQKMDSVSIDGTRNTIVFGAGATAASLMVNSAGNTIYLPIGSTIKVEGPFAAQTTVYRYTPL